MPPNNQREHLTPYQVELLEQVAPLAEHVVKLAHDGVLALLAGLGAKERCGEEPSLFRVKVDRLVPPVHGLHHMNHVPHRELEHEPSLDHRVHINGVADGFGGVRAVCELDYSAATPHSRRRGGQAQYPLLRR
jgi:hypothetical protein